MVARVQGQIDEGRAGQQHRTHDGVVGEPWLRLKRQTPREQELIGVRQTHRDGEERVITGAQSEPGHVSGSVPGVLRPVALPLEGIGGEVDAACAGAREVRRPVDHRSAYVQFTEGGDECLRLRTVLAQGRHEGRVLDTVLPHGGEHPTRTQLQERSHTLVPERPHPVEETHRLTDMAHPVVRRAHLAARHHQTGHVRNDGDLRGMEGQRLRDRAEVVEHRVHAR